MKQTVKHAFGLAVILIVSLSIASAVALTIKRNVKVGETYKYKVMMDLESPDGKASITATSTQKVIDVATDGTVVTEERIFDGKAAFGSQSQDIGELGTSTTKSAMDGTILDVKTEKGTSPEERRTENLMAFYYPTKAIKIGESWSKEVKGEKDVVIVKATFKVISEEKVQGLEAIKIESSAEETQGDKKASCSGTIWIGSKTGMLVKEDRTVKNFPVSGGAVLAGRIRMELEK